MPTEAKPLRADAERNRRRLLDAARELFAAKGLGVGLDEIARHAGVGVGTAYRRFRDKDALVRELFEDRLDLVTALADEGLAMEDPWEGFVHFMRGNATLFAQDRALKELILASDANSDRLREMRAQLKPRVGKLVARAQAAGAVRADMAPLDVPMLNVMVGLLADAARDVAPEVWQRALGIVLDGLAAQRSEPTPLPAPPWTDDQLDVSIRNTVRR